MKNGVGIKKEENIKVKNRYGSQHCDSVKDNVNIEVRPLHGKPLPLDQAHDPNMVAVVYRDNGSDSSRYMRAFSHMQQLYLPFKRTQDVRKMNFLAPTIDRRTSRAIESSVVLLL